MKYDENNKKYADVEKIPVMFRSQCQIRAKGLRYVFVKVRREW